MIDPLIGVHSIESFRGHSPISPVHVVLRLGFHLSLANLRHVNSEARQFVVEKLFGHEPDDEVLRSGNVHHEAAALFEAAILCIVIEADGFGVGLVLLVPLFRMFLNVRLWRRS